MNTSMTRSRLWRYAVIAALTLAAVLFQLSVLPNDEFRLYRASGEEIHFADPEIQSTLTYKSFRFGFPVEAVLGHPIAGGESSWLIVGKMILNAVIIYSCLLGVVLLFVKFRRRIWGATLPTKTGADLDIQGSD